MTLPILSNANKRLSVMIEEKYTLGVEYLFATIVIPTLLCRSDTIELATNLSDKLVDLAFCVTSVIGLYGTPRCTHHRYTLYSQIGSLLFLQQIQRIKRVPSC
jgi:hypothetical protein